MVVGCGGGGPTPAPTPDPDPVPSPVRIAYRLSTRDRRASRAAKAHAANRRFVSAAAAEAGRAHPGDRSRVVPIDVSDAQWTAWFGAGASVIDLRRR